MGLFLGHSWGDPPAEDPGEIPRVIWRRAFWLRRCHSQSR